MTTVNAQVNFRFTKDFQEFPHGIDSISLYGLSADGSIKVEVLSAKPQKQLDPATSTCRNIWTNTYTVDVSCNPRALYQLHFERKRETDSSDCFPLISIQDLSELQTVNPSAIAVSFNFVAGNPNPESAKTTGFERDVDYYLEPSSRAYVFDADTRVFSWTQT